MVSRGILFEDARLEFERRFIVKALEACDGSLVRTASALGIHRNTLSRKIAEFRIRRPR
jgi:DNA-binding NtrC family response regulator